MNPPPRLRVSQDRELANDLRKHVMALFRSSLHESPEPPSMAALGKEQLYYRHMLSGTIIGVVVGVVTMLLLVHYPYSIVTTPKTTPTTPKTTPPKTTPPKTTPTTPNVTML